MGIAPVHPHVLDAVRFAGGTTATELLEAVEIRGS